MKIKQKPKIVRLSDLIAELLNLDEKEVKEKLKPFSEELIKIITSNRRFIIPGVLEIRPHYLEAGSFLNTTSNTYEDVPARLTPRVRLQQRFGKAIRASRLHFVNFF